MVFNPFETIELYRFNRAFKNSVLCALMNSIVPIVFGFCQFFPSSKRVAIHIFSFFHRGKCSTSRERRIFKFPIVDDT